MLWNMVAQRQYFSIQVGLGVFLRSTSGNGPEPLDVYGSGPYLETGDSIFPRSVRKWCVLCSGLDFLWALLPFQWFCLWPSFSRWLEPTFASLYFCIFSPRMSVGFVLLIAHVGFFFSRYSIFLSHTWLETLNGLRVWVNWRVSCEGQANLDHDADSEKLVVNRKWKEGFLEHFCSD